MEDRKSVYSRAAVCGLPLGVVNSLAATMFLYSDKVPVLAYLAMALMLCLPSMVFRYEKAALLEEKGNIDMAGLWIMGILMTVYALLITGLVSFVEMQYLRPQYVYEQVQTAIDTLKQMPRDQFSGELLDEMNRAVAEGLLPRPIEVVMNMFCMSAMAGSFVSLVITMIVTRSSGKMKENK